MELKFRQVLFFCLCLLVRLTVVLYHNNLLKSFIYAIESERPSSIIHPQILLIVNILAHW